MIEINQKELLDGVCGHRAVGFKDVNGNGVIDFYDLNHLPDETTALDLLDSNRNGMIDPEDLLDPLYGCADGADDDGNGFADDLVGWDFGDNDNDVMGGMPGPEAHGTAVLSVLAAQGAVGIAGHGTAGAMFGGARVVPIKYVSSNGNSSDEGYRSNLLKGILYAETGMQGYNPGGLAGADVVNLEGNQLLVRTGVTGFPTPATDPNCAPGHAGIITELTQDKFDKIMNAFFDEEGALDSDRSVLVAPASDCGAHTEDPGILDLFVEAPIKNKIAVTGIDVATGDIFGERNGDSIDVAASATGFSVIAPGGGVAPNLASGTSYAAPLVSGTLGLMVGRNPGLHGDAASLSGQLRCNSPPIADYQGSVIDGSQLDAYDAVANQNACNR